VPETSAPATTLPPVPPPTRPFAAGDLTPDGFAREPEGKTGHDAFVGGVPIPWRCRVVSRTKTSIAAKCNVHSGSARAYYSRIHQGFGRDMFGGNWDEEEQFAFFSRPFETGMRIDISSDREEALYGAVTNGAELRVQHEPAGAPAADPAPTADTPPEDLFLRSFGAWRCGDRNVFVGVRRMVVATREADAVCNAVTTEAGGGTKVRVKCSSVRDDGEGVLPAGTGARWSNEGLLIDVGSDRISFDGRSCRRSSGRER
jgi:hypothetical protein